MAKYILKRALLMIPTLFIVLTVVFTLLRMVPGTPAYELLLNENDGQIPSVEEIEAKETEMGLNDPLPVQWFRFVKGVFKGDWGNSYFNDKPVFMNMIAVWEPSLIIAGYATIITVSIAIPVGIFCATHRNSALDYAISSMSTATMVIPGFCLGLMFVYVFGFKLGWFPTVGYKNVSRVGWAEALYSLTLPSFSLGLHHVASMARYTRSTMLDVLSQDYIRTARAKGLSRQKIYYKHALKNTLSIVGTMIAGSFAGMLGGTSVTEKVFNIKGMGTLAVDSLGRRDYPQEQAIVLFTASLSLSLNLGLDIMYKLLDPRIEYD